MRKINNLKFQTYLQNKIAEIAKLLSLTNYEMIIEKDDHMPNKAVFQIVCSYPYLYAKIYYSDRAIRDFENGIDLEKHIVHELCHMITDPLYVKSTQRFVSEKEIEDERERLTDYMANIICKLKNLEGKCDK